MSQETQSEFPYRPNYQPPQPDDGYQPQVTARAVRVEGSAVEQAHAVMTHAQNEFGRHLQILGEHRSQYSDSGYQAQVKAFAETEAARAVTDSVAKVEQRHVQAAAHVEKVRRDLSPLGDSAAELRAGRTWDRSKQLLDNADAGKVGELARVLISKADRAGLGVLATELAPYLESRGHASEGWMDAALGQAVPEYATAQAQLIKAEQALIITRHNAKALARGFSEGRAPSPLVSPKDYDPDRFSTP